MKATNPYSGESAMLSEQEFALYHLIKHAEETEQWKAVQKGLDKFSRLNAAAYMYAAAFNLLNLSKPFCTAFHCSVSSACLIK